MKGKKLAEEVMENGINRGYAYVVSVGEYPHNYTDAEEFIEAACEECKDLKSVDSTLGVEVQLIDRINHMSEEDIVEEVSEVAPGATVYRVPYEEDDLTGSSYFNIDKVRNLTDDEDYGVEEEDDYMSEEEMDEWGY